MKNKKHIAHKRKNFLKKTAKIHIKVGSFLLVLYLVLAVLIDPRFLLYDFRQKYTTLAANSNVSVSLRIIGRPGAPILTGSSEYENSVSYIQLDWNDTIDTSSYDLYRDGLLLISGLTESTYQDKNIQSNTFYTYKVQARGPGGQTYSNEVIVFSGEHEPPDELSCIIETVNGEKFFYSPPLQQTDDHTPMFTGTTTIANAIIQITIKGPNGEVEVLGNTYANANGYWSWNSPKSLENGNTDIIVTAINPSNSLLSATTSGSFIVKTKKDDDSDSTAETKKTSVPEVIQPAIENPTIEPGVNITPDNQTLFAEQPLRLQTVVENKDHVVYENNQLILSTKLLTGRSFSINEKIELQYVFIDEKGNIAYQFSDNPVIPEDKIIRKNIEISNLIPEGNYRIMVKTLDGNVLVSSEDFFNVQGLYLFTIGSTHIKMSQIMQSLSWIILALFLLALFFGFLLGIEIFLVGTRDEISEYDLQKRGYFIHVRGKEVRK